MTTDRLTTLLHAVLARPEDDNARLVYADALEEAGDGERAKYIRTSISLHNVPAPWWSDRDLEFQKLRHGLNLGIPKEIDGVVRRGFIESVRCSLAAWCGETCGRCLGRGRNDYRSDIDGRGIMTLPCTACHGTRCTPGHGPEIVARHPVERVEFTDAVIMWPREEWSRLENHRTRSSARASLSAAAIRWARAEAVRLGLVPDVWQGTTPPPVAAGGG